MTSGFWSGMLVIIGYLVLSAATGALFLWGQRRFFLHPDEDQSFVIPGATVVIVGMLFLWWRATGNV